MDQFSPLLGLSNQKIIFTLHQIGGSGLLLDEKHQRIFSLDAQTSWLWCCIEDGCDEAETVRLYAEDFGVPLAAAQTAVRALVDGLAALVRPAAACPTLVDPEIGLPHAGLAAPEATAYVRLLDTTFAVAFPSTALRERFRAVMGHLETDPRAVDLAASVVPREPGFLVVLDGKVAEVCEETLEVASQVKSALVHAAINRRDFDACLHAALMKKGESGMLLAADSGSGKSCLALTLAGAGWTCLSDDLTLLDLEGPVARGVPAATCVKADAWEAMSAIHPTLRAAPAHRRIDGKLVKYLPVAVADDTPTAVPVVVFPTYRAGLETRLTPLPPEEALRRILASALAWRAHLTPAVLDGIIAWIESVRAYEFHYAGGEEAVAVLNTVLAADTGGPDGWPKP